MLFSSLTFLFCFLPAVVAGYYICPGRFRNVFLLLTSIFFYAWGEPRYLPVIFTTITISYAGALAIEHFKYKKILLALFVVLDLSLLFYFKYANFFLENLNLIFHQKWSLKVVLPLGISFYTFQALSYLVDVYRGQVRAQKNYLKIALYICLFPQLIAGPIVKYHDVSDQIDNREETIDKVYYGIRRFIIGLAKKVLIANTLGAVADKVFALNPTEFGAGIAWLGAFSYSLQLYYDFSGYSDMAIGLGSIFGFKFLENFNYPFISKSYGEFWARWHISLGRWVKEYIYIPLGGSHCGVVRHYFNIFMALFLIGIWHGANITMLVASLLMGIIVVIERLLHMYEEPRTLLSRIFRHIYLIMMILLTIFYIRLPSFEYGWSYMKKMFFVTGKMENSYPIFYFVDRLTLFIFAIAVSCCMPIFKNMLDWGKKRITVGITVDIWLLALLFLCCMQLTASTYNPFIYFRF